MRTALGVLSSMLMLECGVPDARAEPVEEEPFTSRAKLSRMIAPRIGGSTPEPPLLQRADCSRQRRQDCLRFCLGQYRTAAASRRCIRACGQYCATCPADRRRYCRAN
jgi:hypothetical protein